MRSGTALLTTYRRSGDGVATPVSIAVAGGDRAYFTTALGSGKARRLARDDRVTLAPCTATGRPLGPAVPGRARIIRGRPRARLLVPTRTLFWSYLGYRLRGRDMRFYEVVLTQGPAGTAAQPRPPAKRGWPAKS